MAADGGADSGADYGDNYGDDMVWVLIVEHNGVEDVQVFADEEKAQAGRHQVYVDLWERVYETAFPRVMTKNSLEHLEDITDTYVSLVHVYVVS